MLLLKKLSLWSLKLDDVSVQTSSTSIAHGKSLNDISVQTSSTSMSNGKLLDDILGQTSSTSMSYRKSLSKLYDVSVGGQVFPRN